MTAKEFILETYPLTAKRFENKTCNGLNDIAYICEQYHKMKVQEMGTMESIKYPCKSISDFVRTIYDMKKDLIAVLLIIVLVGIAINAQPGTDDV